MPHQPPRVKLIPAGGLHNLFFSSFHSSFFPITSLELQLRPSRWAFAIESSLWPQPISTGRKIEAAELTRPELTKSLGGKVFWFCFLSYKKNQTWKRKAVLSCEGSPRKVQETSQTCIQFNIKGDSFPPFLTWVLCFWMKAPLLWEVRPDP